MSARPTRTPALATAMIDGGEEFSIGLAYYRTDHELTFYLRALRQVGDGRLVVVVGLRDGGQVPAADLPDTVRLILTAAGPIPADGRVGWVVPDPWRAVLLAMTGRQPNDGLILLFPHDWAGPAPDGLVEKARRWRSGPHSPVDDVYFTHPN